MNKKIKRFLLYVPGITLIFAAGAFANYNEFVLGWKIKGELIWMILFSSGMLLNLRFITKEKQKILTQLKGGKTWKKKF